MFGLPDYIELNLIHYTAWPALAICLVQNQFAITMMMAVQALNHPADRLVGRLVARFPAIVFAFTQDFRFDDALQILHGNGEFGASFDVCAEFADVVVEG